MAMSMTEFLLLADADLSKIWHEDELPYEEQYSRIFNVKNHNELYLKEAKMAGFGTSVTIPEGGDVTYDSAIAPVTRRYDFTKRGLGYKITDKLWKYDRYSEVMKFERDLKRADADDTEIFFFGLLNSATGTTVSTGFDGLALTSTAHTRMDGGANQQNRPTTLTALSLAAVQDAAVAFTKFVDDRGRPYRSNPKTLAIPRDLVLTANEILGSSMKPTTADNTTNALVNIFNISPLVSPYITSTTFWALVGDKHDLNAIWWERAKTGQDVDFDSDTIKRKCTKELGRGHGEWRGFYQGQS